MYFGGDVYSSVDPFATALGCADGKISFIGSDEAAKALDGDAIDLEEDFLTPGFVHAGLVLDGAAPSAEELHEAGFTHVHAIGGAEAIAEFAAAAPRGLSVLDYPNLSEDGTATGTANGRASITAARFLELGSLPPLSLFILVESGERLTELLEALRADPAHAQRHGYRLRLDFTIDAAQVEVLGRNWCELGATVHFHHDPTPKIGNLNHLAAAVANFEPGVKFLMDRLAGVPALNDCGSF